MNSLVDLNDFSLDEIEKILEKAFEIKNCPERFKNAMEGKILATLFFEPSTRTQFSFQTAMYRLGGHTIGFSNSLNSSVSKGEDLKDTIKIVSGYADIIVIRHPLEGAAMLASLFSSCSVVNAGDGGHLHPTQTLTDIFTILEYKRQLFNLTIGVCGDLKYSRTVNSLVEFLNRFKDNKFVLISNEDFKLSGALKENIEKKGNTFIESSSLKDSIKDLDVLYMTRMQKERFEQNQNKKEDLILLNEEILKLAKSDLAVMHPLPRTKEIDSLVDKDKRAIYFDQALNGVYVRMALILYLLEEEKEKKKMKEKKEFVCENKNCITKTEQYLPKYFREDENGVFCEYCGKMVN